MAEWKKNPAVGVVAGIVVLVSLVLVITFIIQRAKSSRGILSEEQKAEQIQGVKKFTPPPPAQ